MFYLPKWGFRMFPWEFMGLYQKNTVKLILGRSSMLLKVLQIIHPRVIEQDRRT
jgi:hypothetical protein